LDTEIAVLDPIGSAMVRPRVDEAEHIERPQRLFETVVADVTEQPAAELSCLIEDLHEGRPMSDFANGNEDDFFEWGNDPFSQSEKAHASLLERVRGLFFPGTDGIGGGGS